MQQTQQQWPYYPLPPRVVSLLATIPAAAQRLLRDDRNGSTSYPSPSSSSRGGPTTAGNRQHGPPTKDTHILRDLTAMLVDLEFYLVPSHIPELLDCKPLMQALTEIVAVTARWPTAQDFRTAEPADSTSQGSTPHQAPAPSSRDGVEAQPDGRFQERTPLGGLKPLPVPQRQGQASSRRGSSGGGASGSNVSAGSSSTQQATAGAAAGERKAKALHANFEEPGTQRSAAGSSALMSYGKTRYELWKITFAIVNELLEVGLIAGPVSKPQRSGAAARCDGDGGNNDVAPPLPALLTFACGLLQGQLLRCCSRWLGGAAGRVQGLLAESGGTAVSGDSAAEVAAGPAAVAEPGASGGGGARGASAADCEAAAESCYEFVLRTMQILRPLAKIACRLADSVVGEAAAAPGEELPYLRRMPFITEFMSAMRKSNVIEHCARSLMMSLELTTKADASAVLNESSLVFLLQAFGYTLYSLQLTMRKCGTVMDTAFSSAASGPCTQHLLLSSGLITLCAADGGSFHGLPRHLRQHLPVLGFDRDKALVDLRQLHGRQEVEICVVFGLIAALIRGVKSPAPPSKLVGFRLLMRVGRFILESARVWATVRPEDEQEDGDEEEERDGARQGRAAKPLQPVLPRDFVVDFAQADVFAIDQHLKALSEEESADEAWVAARTDRWRLVVSIVRDCVQFADTDELYDIAEMLIPEELQKVLTNDANMLPQPKRALACALAGGVLPCLERMLRRAGRNPEDPHTVILLHVLRSSDIIEHYLGGMMAYGDPRQAAALLITLGKLLRRLVPKLTHAIPRALGRCPEGSSAAGSGSSTGGGARSSSSSSVGMDVTELALAGKIMEIMNCVIMHGPDLMSARILRPADAERVAAIKHQVPRLALLALYDWLPQLSRLIRATAQAPPLRPQLRTPEPKPEDVNRCMTVLSLAITLVSSWLQFLPPLLQGLKADTSRRQAGSARTQGSGSAAATDAPAAAAAAAAKAALWGLLTDELEVASVVGAALRLAAHPKVQRVWDNKRWLYTRLADGLLHVATTCPEKVRAACMAAVSAGSASRDQQQGERGAGSAATSAAAAAAGAGGSNLARSRGRDDSRKSSSIGAGAGRSSSSTAPSEGDLAYWPPRLLRALAIEVPDVRSSLAMPVMASQLEDWCAGKEVSLERGPLQAVGTNNLISDHVHKTIKVLVHPAEARSLLRTCSNPGCANLDGDSEAAVELWACSRCGAARYCCRSCQAAHWKAGHKAVCKERKGE